MRKNRIAIVASCAVVILAGALQASCWQKGHPQVVLTCLQNALADHDSTALSALVSDDFVAEWVPSDEQSAPADKAAFVRQHTRMWHAGGDLRIVDFGKVSVTAASVPNSWVIECRGQAYEARSAAAESNSPMEYSQTVTYSVRQIGKKNNAYEIYHATLTPN